MRKFRFLPHGYQGCILSIVGIFVAVGLTILSVNYQHPDPLICRGLPGAGFPVPFICDASGESPLSSVGKINSADLDNLNPFGSLVDILFYIVATWIVWFVVRYIPAKGRHAIR